MLTRRAGWTALAAAGLSAVLGIGLAGPASAAPAVTAHAATSQGKPVRDPFPGWPAAKIYKKSIGTASAARAVRVRAHFTEDGQTIKVDAVLGGHRGMARVSAPDGSVVIVRDRLDLYMSGDKKFWLSVGEGETTPTEAAELADKWILVKANDEDIQEMRDFTTLPYWVDALKEFRPVKRVAGKQVGRMKTVGLLEPGREGAVLYVAAKGVPYPVLIEANDRSGAISFSDWNVRPSIAVPHPELVVE